jgi:hypothetical protein
VGYIQPITIERTGKRGRPRKVIEAEFLKEAFNPSRSISINELASVLNVHRNTLRSYIQEYGIQAGHSELSDENLDQMVQSFREAYPDSGLRYARGYLHKEGFRVQKERISSSLGRVDGIGQTVRQVRRREIRRQAYQVARPNALWHIDGHHKLILWGIVIHGCVDGHSRTVSDHLMNARKGSYCKTRSQASRQAITTEQGLFSTCFLMRSNVTASLPVFVVTVVERIKKSLFS